MNKADSFLNDEIGPILEHPKKNVKTEAGIPLKEINLMLLKNLLKELKMMRGHKFFLVLQVQVKLSQWRKLLN